ncbi:MAG: AbrB/MazE/SpoVT family DNA-binding domain-containing protein [Rhodospirillales bacterium]|nr:AbrB/MazE/SpoVT family DNA-binding domain-containing protein [Rhodospirillales bacterium]
MRSHVAKWGNSLSLRLPKAFVDHLHLKEGDAVDLDVDGGHLRVTPAKPSYELKNLLSEITKDNQPESFDTSPMGQEIL